MAKNQESLVITQWVNPNKQRNSAIAQAANSGLERYRKRMPLRDRIINMIKLTNKTISVINIISSF